MTFFLVALVSKPSVLDEQTLTLLPKEVSL